MKQGESRIESKAREAQPKEQPAVIRRLQKVLQAPSFPESSIKVPTEFTADSGHCFFFNVPKEWTSDAGGVSAIRVLEDGQHLGPAIANHDEIRKLGEGRYSHWGSVVFFATSDNSDPNTNGRVYSVVPPDGWSDSADGKTWWDCQWLRPEASAGHVQVQWAVVNLSSETIQSRGGKLYASTLREDWLSDSDSLSTLLVLEDGKVLGRPHCTSDEILERGEDAFGHWGQEVLFASTDGSDPRSNGRTYQIAYAPAFRFEHATTTPITEKGHCWILNGIPAEWPSSKIRTSRLALLEDGKPLPTPHASHDLVRKTGKGAYCHWGDQLYFSTSDNSDPTTNGRTYTVVWQPAMRF